MSVVNFLGEMSIFVNLSLEIDYLRISGAKLLIFRHL
jgi:hypothetical protein